MQYKDTLGHHIGSKRLELDLSEQQLADAVNAHIREGLKTEYSRQDVKDWESNRVLPDDREAEALIKLLITQNGQVSDKEKEAQEKSFRKALQKTRTAFAEGKLIPGESYIGNKISELRDEKTEAELAQMVTSVLNVQIPVTKEMIYNLEHGSRYDRKLMDDVLAVHVKQGTISEEEAKSVSDRYAQLEKKNPTLLPEPRNLYEAHQNLLNYFGKDVDTYLKRSKSLDYVIEKEAYIYTREPLTPESGYNEEIFSQLVAKVHGHYDAYKALRKEFWQRGIELLGSHKDNLKYTCVGAEGRYNSDIREAFEHSSVIYGFRGRDGRLDQEQFKAALLERSIVTPPEKAAELADKIVSLKLQIIAELEPVQTISRG